MEEARANTGKPDLRLAVDMAIVYVQLSYAGRYA